MLWLVSNKIWISSIQKLTIPFFIKKRCFIVGVSLRRLAWDRLQILTSSSSFVCSFVFSFCSIWFHFHRRKLATNEYDASKKFVHTQTNVDFSKQQFSRIKSNLIGIRSVCEAKSMSIVRRLDCISWWQW